MDMIRHDFQVFHLCLMLLTDLPDNVFSACFNCLHQHFSPVFRTPDHMGAAPVEHVPVALVGFDHLFHYTAERYLLSRADVPDRHCPGSPTPKKERAFHAHGSSTRASMRG